MFHADHITPGEYLNQSIEVITSGFGVGKLDAAAVREPTASRLVEEGLARRVAASSVIGDRDGAFIDIREDLARQRPDVVKGWLEAELDAELFLADPKNAAQVVKFAREQTTGLTDEALWAALHHACPAASGGVSERLAFPFAFTPDIRALIQVDTEFLYSVRSIAVGELPEGAVPGTFAEAVLEQDAFACAHGSCSRPLFDRVIQTCGDSAFGHHALGACPRNR